MDDHGVAVARQLTHVRIDRLRGGTRICKPNTRDDDVIHGFHQISRAVRGEVSFGNWFAKIGDSAIQRGGWVW
jgi:ATP-dependent RNA circularization protein (DNA/RNA ligase family)